MRIYWKTKLLWEWSKLYLKAVEPGWNLQLTEDNHIDKIFHILTVEQNSDRQTDEWTQAPFNID